jgi:hypothetical protein
MALAWSNQLFLPVVCCIDRLNSRSLGVSYKDSIVFCNYLFLSLTKAQVEITRLLVLYQYWHTDSETKYSYEC